MGITLFSATMAMSNASMSVSQRLQISAALMVLLGPFVRGSEDFQVRTGPQRSAAA